MRALQRLAGHFLDVMAGLPTLKIFGRAKAQARSIAAVTDRYRSATMATLRLTFLSSLILELLATVSVALVAVAVGLRLLGGHMSFQDALFVLVLAPEAYLPLRALGANYHASADGLKASAEIFDLLETPGTAPAGGARRARDTSIAVAGLDLTYRGTQCAGAPRHIPVRRTRRDRRAHGAERVRQVHAPFGDPRPATARRWKRHPRRGGPGRARPGRLATADRLGTSAASSVRAHGGGERPGWAGPRPPTRRWLPPWRRRD